MQDPRSYLQRQSDERKIRNRDASRAPIDTTTFDYAVKVALTTGEFSNKDKSEIQKNLGLDSPIIPPGPGSSSVLSGITSYWDNQPELIASAGVIYEYTDYKRKSDGNFVSGFKIGDGRSYLKTLPFKNADTVNHIYNPYIHSTPEEKTEWNNKITCKLSDDNTTLIFSNT